MLDLVVGKKHFARTYHRRPSLFLITLASMHPSLGECNFSRIYRYPFPLFPWTTAWLWRAQFISPRRVRYVFILFEKTNASGQRERIIIFHPEERGRRAAPRHEGEKEREQRRDKRGGGRAVKKGTRETRARRSSIIADFIALFRIFRQTKGLVKFVRADVYRFSLPGLSYPAYHRRFSERFSIAINCSTAWPVFSSNQDSY